MPVSPGRRLGVLKIGDHFSRLPLAIRINLY